MAANFYLCFSIILTGISAESGGVNNDVEMKISQGFPTSIEQYPSLVQMEFYVPDVASWLHSCAANILNEYYVLSAAHCFYGDSVFNRRIRAGSTIRETGGVVINVASAYIHPNYIPNYYESDISVARLYNPLHYSSTIQPANVIYQDIVIPDGTEVKVAGWGRTSKNGSDPDNLLDTTIYTVDHEECVERNNAFQDDIMIVTDNMICAGLLDIGGRDACTGDSGGGLFYQGTLIGIVSWGRDCGDSFFPGVYTKISPFRYWIESIANNN